MHHSGECVIQKAILAEFDHRGGSRQPDQTHIADKLSAKKRKGKTPQFKQQRGTNHQSTADDQAGPSSNKRRCNCPNRGQKDTTRQYQSEYIYNGSYCKNFMSDIELIQCPTAAVRPQVPQPSRAGPSQSTVMLIISKGVSYQKKPLQQPAVTFKGVRATSRQQSSRWSSRES